MADSLIPARFLFRFSAPCFQSKLAWKASGIELAESYRLPALCELDSQKPYADVRMAWSEEGLAVTVHVEGKKHAIWARESSIDDSDGLQLWIDTRDTHNIHRASRFCHRFAFLPAGGGRGHAEPVADQLLVDRARENANPVRPGLLKIVCRKSTTGYHLSGLIPADALTGYNPADHPKLGFTYFLFDREFGEQSFSVGSQFPFPADPSLWGTLELAPAP